LLAGVAAFLGVLLFSGIADRRDRIGAAMLAVLPPALPAAALLAIGRRLRHKPGDLVLTEDQRAPVLYLRSLAFDGPLAKGNWEESLAGLFGARVGPPVCIGRPGERLPRAGFHRIYVPRQAWQERVKDLIRRARCVVFVQGATEGLAWELKTLVDLVDPERFLLLIPLHRYGQLKKRAETCLPLPLPKRAAFCPGMASRFDDVAAILFYEDWRPVPLPVKCGRKVGWLSRQPWINWPIRRNGTMDIELTIQPFVERIIVHLPPVTSPEETTHTSSE
jgi:hypothetical protein